MKITKINKDSHFIKFQLILLLLISLIKLDADPPRINYGDNYVFNLKN